MNDTILKLLREEHRVIENLFHQIETSREISQKKEFYLILRETLTLHIVGEEKTLYTHLAQDINEEEAEELAKKAVDDHQEIKNLFIKMDSTWIENPIWETTFQKLKSCFIKHINDEEAVLFKVAKEDFSKEELSEFADEFVEIKSHTTF